MSQRGEALDALADRFGQRGGFPVLLGDPVFDPLPAAMST